ncbi:AHH domain-containing protein [Methylomonas koyamae]|uniref:AHH domain-containing protein n=1 Tax=Methylomonas TaxID=416 RepID=UPI000BDF35E2
MVFHQPVKGIGQLHHIATDKAIKTGYTAQFKEIFDKAGMNLNDLTNKVLLEGYKMRRGGYLVVTMRRPCVLSWMRLNRSCLKIQISLKETESTNELVQSNSS